MVEPDGPEGPGTRYPVHWEADVVLRDGGTAHVRPIRGTDAPALQAFHVGQSERSTYFRFFAPLERLPERDLTRFTNVDHVDRVALVAVAGQDADERIIAVGRYDRVDRGTAEVAFNVADGHHGRGLGSVLLEHLSAAARERGIAHFTAEVLPQNSQMLAIFREAGYAVSQHLDDGIVTVDFDIDPTDRSRAVMADREHRAEARSVRGMLTPRTVLVACDDDGARRAAAVVDNLLTVPGPAPEVHTVGPLAPRTGATAWDSVDQAPEHVDLLVLSTRAADALERIRACAGRGPRAVVVVSEGFAETGPEGLALQRALVRTAHASGMRLLGPASFGFLRHADEENPAVNVSLATPTPPPGTVGMMCQSAPMAVGLLESARRRGLGLSTFVSAGNRADVSGNDVMQFWTEDDRTTVAALYLESIGNPRKFSRVARRLAAVKPVVVLPAGRSGHVVPAGHVLRRTRAPRRALDEVMRQAGVIRVESTHQLLDVTQLLAHQPVPVGRRVAVVATREPLAALVAEAASSAGLTVVDQRAVPVDDGPGGLERLEDVLAEVHADPSNDAVMVVHVPLLGGQDGAVARLVARTAAASGRTTVACLTGLRGITEELTAQGPDGGRCTVPAYAAPEDGVLALAAAARYGAWRATDRGRPLDPSGVDRARAREVVEAALAGAGPDPVRLDQEAAGRLLAAYGLTLWPTRVVRDVTAARTAAEELGWPVALKCAAEHLRHRIDLGGVRLDITGPGELEHDMAQMRAHLETLGEEDPALEVQRMAPGGVACVIRSSEDPRFGPVVSFGLAGDAVDLLGDVAYGVAPLTDVDVRELVRTVRASPRLFGYRGLPDLDVGALEDVLARVATMAEDLPELYSLELHPVVVAERGASVLGCRVELAGAGRADGARRALPQ